MTNENIQVFNGQPVPSGDRLIYTRNRPLAPDRPVIPFIEGDGAGASIWRATRRAVDAAVHKAYDTQRSIAWYEVFAGARARDEFGEWLPDDTVEAVKQLGICMIGELFEPVATGVRNKLLKAIGLPHRMRLVMGFPGWCYPTVLSSVPRLLVVSETAGHSGVFVDFEPDNPLSAHLAAILEKQGQSVPAGSAMAVASYSRPAVAGVVRRAVATAASGRRQNMTLVHRGEPGRTAENLFKEWSYQYLEEQFKQMVVTNRRLETEFAGVLPENSLLIRDLSLNDFLVEFQTNTEKHDIVITTCAMGEILGSVLNSSCGMTRLAPQALVGDAAALFVASSLAAEPREKMDLANPLSSLMSAIMMLEFIGWREAADLLYLGISSVIDKKLITYDLESQVPGGTKIKTSEFATVIIDRIVKD